MSQVQDPGASRSSDSNSDVSHRSEELLLKILDAIERQKREKDDSIRDLTRTINMQTKCIKDLQAQMREFEAKSATEWTPASTMLEKRIGMMENHLGETLLSRMEQLFYRNEEYTTDERSVTEPPTAAISTHVQQRSFPSSAQGNLNSNQAVADNTPNGNRSVSEWATGSQDAFVPSGSGPSHHQERNPVEEAYINSAFPSGHPNHRAQSQPGYQQDHGNHYNNDFQVRVLRRLHESACSLTCRYPQRQDNRRGGGHGGFSNNNYNNRPRHNNFNHPYQHPGGNRPQMQRNDHPYRNDNGFIGMPHSKHMALYYILTFY